MTSSDNPKRDLRYELDLFRRIGAVRLDGVRAYDVALADGYGFYERFAQTIFGVEVRRFAESRNFEQYVRAERGSALGALKGFLIGLFAAALSLSSFLTDLVRRPDILIFSVDRVSDQMYQTDFRVAPLYEYFASRKLSYRECFHSLLSKNLVLNFFARRRAALYLEAADTFAFLLPPRRRAIRFDGLQKLNPEEARFAEYVLGKYRNLERFVALRRRMLRAYFFLVRPKAVWGIDDARNYHDLILAARDTRIPIHLFQHGHYTPYHVGWLADPRSSLPHLHPDTLVVQNEYWKRELHRLGSVFPGDSIIIGGSMRPATRLLPEKTAHAGMQILVPHETDSPKSDMSEILTRLTKANLSIILKLRPDLPVAAQLSEYPNLPKVTLIVRMAELTDRPDAALGVYSSFLYDMAEEEIPVGVLTGISEYGRGLVENGLAEEIPEGEGLIEAVRALAALPAAERARRKERYEGTPHSFTATLDSLTINS